MFEGGEALEISGWRGFIIAMRLVFPQDSFLWNRGESKTSRCLKKEVSSKFETNDKKI
jgi:hypothetical protein